MTDTTETGGFDRIEPVDIQTEMQRSYIDYAMSVIVGRALPDVRDGLKPVHRKILYGMYDSGFRPDRSYVKCGRVVGDVMGNYHPHGDSALYDALVRMAQPWSLRYPMIDPQGNFGSPGNDPAAAYRYTECRLQPLAMEMLRDIDEETVDFVPNYAGNTVEPVILPARIPNLLVNGAEGIAVGMATNIPPHNLREVAAGVTWALDHPDATDEELLEELHQARPRSGLPDQGADRRPRRHRGRLPHRPRFDPDARGGRTSRRTSAAAPSWSSPSCPTRSTRTTSSSRSPRWPRTARSPASPTINDESSDRIGMRIVITLKRDAVAKVVLNNLFKHTQLQTTFGANMLAIVDGVPRTLRLDQFVTHYVEHQIEVIVRRTRYRLRQAEERAHILRGYLKALDQLDAVIALIRSSPSAEESKAGLMELLDIDEIQADGDPGPAAAPAGRAGAAEDHRRGRRDRGEDRRPATTSWPSRGGSGTIIRDELDRDRRQVRRRAAHPAGPLRRRRVDGGPDRAGGRGRHHHPDRLRQAHQDRPVPGAAARRQGRAGRGAEDRRHRRALLRQLHPRLDPVLHQQGPGVPGQGLRAARGQPQRPRPARGEPAGLPAGRDDRRGHRASRTTRSRRTWCWPPRTGWSRRPS